MTKEYNIKIKVRFSEEKHKLDIETLVKQIEKKLSNGEMFPITFLAEDMEYEFLAINFDEVKND